MKTAEEMEDSRLLLIGQIAYCAETKDWKRCASLLEQHDKWVALDAYKQGCTDAAEIAKKDSTNSTGDYAEGVKDTSANIEYLILTLRDNKTMI